MILLTIVVAKIKKIEMSLRPKSAKTAKVNRKVTTCFARLLTVQLDKI